MDCTQSDHRILDYLENQMSPGDRGRFADHLASCEECRALAEQLKRLDCTLAGKLKKPELPPEFSSRLAVRLQWNLQPLSAAERAERKRQLQAEFDQTIETLKREVCGTGGVRYVPGCALVAGIVGLVTWCLEHAMLQAHAASSSLQWLPLIWICGVGFLLVGLAVSFPRQFKRFWAPGN
jgi:anti-sigma factor RsiW